MSTRSGPSRPLALVGSILELLENEIRGLLKTFGVMFGKRVGGFMRRAEEIIAEELDVAPELRPIFEAVVAERRAILERIRKLEAVLRAAEAELDAATSNSDLKLAARRLMRARRHLLALQTQQSPASRANAPTPPTPHDRPIP